MKISNSIRELYSKQLELNISLEKEVKELIAGKKHENWFYKGRIKQPESFAQKLQTGRFTPDSLEDFFACTIVVENKNNIADAIKLIETYCVIIYQRPKNKELTHKFPDVFSFDDLRLYVKLKSSDTNPPKPWDNIVFEVQVKTFLQHAWAIATHDLIYKGDSISWGKARLAFQIKAMLEHAEISIEQVENISKSSELALIDPKTKIWKDILAWLLKTWSRDLLPTNIVGLVQTISEVLDYLNIQFKDIQECIEKDTKVGFGSKSINLSPYESIIRSIANQMPEKFVAFLNNNSRYNKGKLLITPEMEIDSILEGATKNRIVFSSVARPTI